MIRATPGTSGVIEATGNQGLTKIVFRKPEGYVRLGRRYRSWCSPRPPCVMA